MFQISQNVLVNLSRTLRNAHKIHDIQEKVMQQNYNFGVVHL